MDAAAQSELSSDVRDGRALHLLDDGAYHEAMSRAGHLLASRPRTERELADRLIDAGFDEHVTARVLNRLRELKLVDDADFARRWIEERSRSKGLAGKALVAELVRKGVDEEVARATLEAAALDEEAAASELAASLVCKVAARPLREQAARVGRMLARRGYSDEAIESAVRSVLPPEGWD